MLEFEISIAERLEDQKFKKAKAEFPEFYRACFDLSLNMQIITGAMINAVAATAPLETGKTGKSMDRPSLKSKKTADILKPDNSIKLGQEKTTRRK